MGGRDFEVPPLPAARWLEVLLSPQIDPEAWFPGFCDPEIEMAVWQMLDEGVASREEFETAVWETLEQISGRRWWITLRLCASVRIHWEWVGGVFALRGLDAGRVSLGCWLDAAYKTMLDGILERSQDLKKVGDWNRALTTAPAGKVQVDDKENGDAFLAALRAAR